MNDINLPPLPESLGDVRAQQFRAYARAAVLADREARGEPFTCTWYQEDDDSGCWAATCGFRFNLVDGTPAENGMKFCCSCGKPLVGEPWVEPNDEDEA